MKNYIYRTNEVRNALIKAGYKPTPKKSRKNKKILDKLKKLCYNNYRKLRKASKKIK